jgi:hypothetical protein
MKTVINTAYVADLYKAFAGLADVTDLVKPELLIFW